MYYNAFIIHNLSYSFFLNPREIHHNTASSTWSQLSLAKSMVSKVPVIKLSFLKNLPIHITSPSLKEGVSLVLRVGCESFLRTEYRDLFVSYFQIWLWMKWCQFSSGRVGGVLTPSTL